MEGKTLKGSKAERVVETGGIEDLLLALQFAPPPHSTNSNMRLGRGAGLSQF